MKKFFYRNRGVKDALKFQKANFRFVVVESGEVSDVQYLDRGRAESYKLRTLLISELGPDLACDHFLCTGIQGDAVIELEKGDVISGDLQFVVNKNSQGSYQQTILIKNIVKLTDYFEVVEEETVPEPVAMVVDLDLPN